MKVMWVGSEYERICVEPLEKELAPTGLVLLPERAFFSEGGPEKDDPVLILALLSGDADRDTATCRRLADRTTAPIIAISTLSSENYLLSIFDTGVDDFILRPIKTRELAARIRTILRRTQPGRMSQLAHTTAENAGTETSPPAGHIEQRGTSQTGITKSIQALFSRLFCSVAA